MCGLPIGNFFRQQRFFHLALREANHPFDIMNRNNFIASSMTKVACRWYNKFFYGTTGSAVRFITTDLTRPRLVLP
jgi:hypothetical protein